MASIIVTGISKSGSWKWHYIWSSYVFLNVSCSTDGAITNVQIVPLCFSCPLLSQTISTLFEMQFYQTIKYFSPLSVSQMSCCLYLVLHMCGCTDRQCLQNMCFSEYGFFTTGCQIIIQSCLWDEGCWTFQNLWGFSQCPWSEQF